MDRLRVKSVSLTAYMEFLLQQRGLDKFSIVTPSEKGRRGAQLSLRIAQKGRAFCEKLAEEGLIGDWREPDTFRVAAVPLYNTFQDVWRFAERFATAFQ